MPAPGMGEPPPRASLVITLDHTGRLQVNGPLTDPILCFGLLEMARGAMHEMARKGAESQIIRPFPGTG